MWMALEPPSGSLRGPTELVLEGPGFQGSVSYMLVIIQTNTSAPTMCSTHYIGH